MLVVVIRTSASDGRSIVASGTSFTSIETGPSNTTAFMRGLDFRRLHFSPTARLGLARVARPRRVETAANVFP